MRVTTSIAAPAQAKRQSGFQNLTVGSGTVLALAIISALWLPGLVTDRSAGPTTGTQDLGALIPHLLIIISISTGFRIVGEIMAFPIGLLYGAGAALLGVLAGLGGTGMQGPDNSMLSFAVVQVVMTITAAADLTANRKRPHQAVRGIHRLLGLAVPATVLLIAVRMAIAAEHRQQERIRSLAVDRQLQARFDRERWMQNSSLDDLLRLASCVERFRGDSVVGPPPKSIRQLYSWSTTPTSHSEGCANELFQKHVMTIDSDNAKEIDSLPHPRWQDKHHVIYYAPPTRQNDPIRPARFTLGIEAVWDSAEFPNASTAAGARSYYLDADGNVHVTAEHRRATLADPLVAVCDSGENRLKDGSECVRRFSPRQRWGSVQALSMFVIDIFGTDVSSDTKIDGWFYQASPYDSVRSVTVDWDDGSPLTTLNMGKSESMKWTDKRGVLHEVRPHFTHRYREAGQRTIRVRLVTVLGEEFIAEKRVLITQNYPVE